MKFQLIDAILEQDSDRIVAVKNLTSAEEYLADHFPSFPVMPGVMMIETLVQAGRLLVRERTGKGGYVLGEVRALRYGSFVRPGDTLRVTVTITGEKDGLFKCKGEGQVIHPGYFGNTGGGGGNSVMEKNQIETAVSGRFTLRPLRLAPRWGAR